MLIHLEKLGKTFGEKIVLHDVTASVEREDRIGIVGQNGAGKTTLLKILTGEYTDYEGEFSVTHGVTLGYLEQNAKLDPTLDIYGEMRSCFAHVLDAMAQMQILERRMAASPEDASLLEQHDALQNIIDAADGYNMDVNIKKVLSGMGFAQDTWEKNIAVLSGGELTRLRLAKLLLEKPDVLILDEPTNHLDFATMEWLENYLKGYSGAVLVVSHDRYFLDHVCTGIVEILMGSSEQYNGNYTRYIAQRQERFESRMRAYEIQQKEIERQQAIIARYRMFNREKSIRAAESREKALDRMEKLEKPVDERAIRFSFEARRRTGEDVLQLTEISKSFGEKHLFHDLTLRVRAGDRVALIGPNGVGKSTLIKIIVGEEQPDTGFIRYGSNVDIGYYDQHQSTLHADKTALDEIWDRFPQMEQSNVRGALGMFLFTGDDVFKPIHTLSGGEKGRVALTALMLRKDNLLLLDEPTNHLDMDSREVLEDALTDFGGTIITVSHDRYFINRIANRIIEMQPDGVTEYIGNYDDYIERKNRPVAVEVEAGKTKTELEKEKRREKLSRQALRQLKIRAQEAEKAVGVKEAEIAELEAQMADPSLYSDAQKSADVQRAYQKAQQALQTLYEQWEAAEAALSQEEA